MRLIAFIKAKTPLEIAKKRPEFEYVFSYLAGIHVRHGGLLAAPWAGRHDPEKLSQLAEAVKDAVDGLTIEPGIIARNPGISPLCKGMTAAKEPRLRSRDARVGGRARWRREDS